MKLDRRGKTFSWIIAFFLLLALAGFVLLAVSLSVDKNGYRDLDFFTFWLGGRLASQRQDVYNSTQWVGAHSVYGSTWIPNLYYVYPLFTALLFIPIGLMPIETASLVWLVLSFVAILASVLLLIKLLAPQNWRQWIIPFVLALCIFRPVILIFLMGQIGGLLLLLIVLAVFFISKGKSTPAHILLAFLLVKPNIGVPLLAFYGAWLVWRGQWKNLAVLGGASLGLLLIPMLLDPGWIQKYISVGLYKSQIDNLYPTLRGLAGLLTANQPLATTILWAAGSLALLVGMIMMIVRLKNMITTIGILCLSILFCLLVTPYLRSYDFLLLLIPILYVTLSRVKPGDSISKPTLRFLFWGISSLALLVLATTLDHDIWSVAYPLAVLGAFIVNLWMDHKKRKAESTLSENKNGVTKGGQA